MRSTRNTKYRLQMTIMIIVISLFVLFMYTQRQEPIEHEELIEKPVFVPKKARAVEHTPVVETVTSDSTNCAYKVH